MKKIIVTIALAAGMILSATAQHAYKFGHLNVSELIVLMPERDSAQAKLEAYGEDLQEQIETLQVELNNKFNMYQTKQASWTEAIREAKEKEIQEMNQRIQDFQRTAQEDFSRMQQTLLRPVIEKANAAISKVGKDNGFTYIFDTSTGVLSFFNTDHSENVLPLVKAELKIPADKVAPVTPPATAR
ncbi:MAG: OmpH family outer membrane protein [Prevotellaceae bacterium]|jgi:outer membrane protein|nr:OmpH family outer membrane protein [Prevotellaceae bacterium]